MSVSNCARLYGVDGAAVNPVKNKHHKETTMKKLLLCLLIVLTAGTKELSIKPYLASLGSDMCSNIHIYLNAESISDMDQYWK